MKNVLNKFFAFTMLMGFLYVQVPFAAFHHHDHKPVCELSDHARSTGPVDHSKKHFHANTNTSCFLCSAQLLKEYQVKDHAFSLSITFVETQYLGFAPQLFSSSLSSAPARAPPVSA